MRGCTLLLLACLLPGCGEPARPVLLLPAEAPASLAEWGVLAVAGGRLRLPAGVTPYELNAPLFSDYAQKLRAVWMPPGSSAQYDEHDEFSFPPGTIISKTFYYPKAAGASSTRHAVLQSAEVRELARGEALDLDAHVLLETRLLVRYADGWRGFPYVWNPDQEDARLQIAGDVIALRLVADAASEDINYIVPDANQCQGCHTPDHSSRDMRPLGPKAWQLQRSHAWWGDAGSQLEHWAAAGLLRGMPAAVPAAAETADQRVKAYLDANCAHCHNRRGAADTSALHLNIDAPLDRHYGICKPPVAVGRGSGDRPYDIFPGRPDASILLYRMEHSDPAIAMPELGRSVVHAEGVAMVSAWIAGLPGDC